MNRVLKEGCKWVLDGKYFDSEEALDLYIRSRIEDGTYNVTDGELKISQSVDLQQRAKDIIERIKLDLAGVSVLVTPANNPNFNGEQEDFEPYYKIPNSIGVNRFLQNCNKPGTNQRFVNPFDKAEWRRYTKEQLIASGKTEIEANNIIKETEETWPELSEIGTEVHKIFEQVFNGEVPIHQGNTKLSDRLFNSVVEQAKALKSEILANYPGAAIYTELGIMTDKLTPEVKDALDAMGHYNSINGKIDLLVIDKQGNAHLYDFKVSRKEVGDWTIKDAALRKNHDWWDIGKMDSASYQLAFYAAMLKQQGIAVRDANVVPVKLELSYEDPENKAKVKSVDSVTIQQTKDHLPDIISGRFAQPINGTVEQAFRETGESITKLLNIFNQFFPKNTTLQRIESTRANTEYYRHNDKYVKELRASDYKPQNKQSAKFKFTQWGLPGHPVVWCNNEEELQAALESYVNSRSSAKADFCEEFGNAIQDIMSGNAEQDVLSEKVPDDKKDWVSTRFKRYFNEGWSLESNEDLILNGIFIFSLGNRSEVVIIEQNDLNTILDLGMGKTLLGKNTKDKYIDKTKILDSSNANLGLMQAMIYIANNQDAFKDKRITEVSVINPNLGQEKTQLNSRLIYNYNQLCDKNPEVDTPKILADCFFEDADALIQNAESRLQGEGETIIGLVEANSDQQQVDYLEMLIAALKNKHKELYNEYDVNKIQFTSPIWQAYYYLTQARLALNGEFTSGESNDTGMWFGKGMKLNGYMIQSAQYSTSSDLRQFGKLLQNYESDVAKQVYKTGWKVEQAFIKLYEAEGNGSQVFDTWFRRNSDGSLNERLLLKDPDSSDFKGSSASREALKLFLETMCKLRRPNATETEIEEMKATEEYYEVPLTEAVWSRQMKGNIRDEGFIKGSIKTIRDKWKEAATLTKNVFAEDEVDVIKSNRLGRGLYNKFELKGDPRLQKIRQHGVGFFETNMEIVFNQALVAFTRVEVAKDYIPRIQAMKLGLKYAQDHGGVENAKIQDALDKMIRSKFYGETIIEEGALRDIYKWLSFVRSIFTTMTLSVNIPSFLRESLQGIYTGISRAGVNLLPGVDEKNYIKGLTHVIQDAHKNFSSVSLLQQLNAQYQMANQSINQIANQRRVNWINIKNWSKDTLFLTATAPDFMHRVSILVAKMMGDGCWEAHSLNEDGQLVYDFKKDKRFEQYLNGNTEHKDYLAYNQILHQ